MNIGIIQGRLSPPKKGFQECPENWLREFALLDALGLSHIDWIVTGKSFKSNPIFFDDVSGYSINSICADNLVNECVIFGELESNLVPICNAAVRNNIKNITIPLLEDSSVREERGRRIFIDLMLPIADMYKDLNFSFEAELEAEKLLEIVELRDNFFITYDTGNITSCGYNHGKYINLVKHKIDNVHLKDRTFEAQSVEPLTGDTNFQLIFKTLQDINYNGLYTLQTMRGQYGNEVDTISNHKKLFEEIMNEQPI
jgi:L-ribulose-5-phosphate 3-epimerase